MSTDPNPEKKLVIDEDWKSQVEAEKEAARQAGAVEIERAVGRAACRRASSAAAGRPRLPDRHLVHPGSDGPGAIAQPRDEEGRRSTRPGEALDRLAGGLQRKTEGNRTPEETGELDAVLHELRMAYVAVQQKVESTPDRMGRRRFSEERTRSRKTFPTTSSVPLFFQTS